MSVPLNTVVVLLEEAHWKKTDQKVNTVSLQVVQIQLKRMQALQKILTHQLASDGTLYHTGNWQGKEEICCKLALMPAVVCRRRQKGEI